MRWMFEPTALADGREERWRSLSIGAGTPNPSMEPEFVVPAARHVPELRSLRLFVVEEAGEWIALLPLYRSSRRGSLPTLPGLRGSWQHSILGEPLVRSGFEAAAADCLLACLASSRGAWWLRLEMLDADGPFATSLLEGARCARMRAHVDFYSRGMALRRPQPTYLTETPHANLGRLRRQRQAFERTVGGPVEVVDRSSDARAVVDFMEMEAAGWKGRSGIAFLTRPGHSAFLAELCAGFRAAGRLRVWCLRAGQIDLAMKLNLLAGDSLFCYLITYSEAYARLSPGLQLEVENFARFHDEPAVRVMDSCASASNAFVNRLYPERRALVDVTIGAGVGGRAVVSLVPALRRASLARRPARSG
jgi:CelD/BcsL family acetyltransferase involved in cellulose biosynthesis